MAVMDEFKEEREQIKHQPLKKRLAYFWNYYKWFVLGGIFILIVGLMIYKDFSEKKEDALYGIIVNGYSLSDEEPLAAAFEEYAGIDTTKYSVSFNSSLHINETMDESGIMSGEFITVYMAAGDLDVAAMNPENFQKYAYAEGFLNLADYLDASLLEQLSDRLYYMDYALVKEVDRLNEQNLSMDSLVFPDPKKPEEMAEPIPVGIDLTDCTKFTDAYYYEEKTAYLGMVATSKSPDMAVKFIEFLFAEK